MPFFKYSYAMFLEENIHWLAWMDISVYNREKSLVREDKG